MASRFTLPHIDIVPFGSSHEYQGTGAGGGVGVRDRIEHGKRMQTEFAAAMALSDALRPRDDRLDPSEGSFVEVDLRSGTNADILDQKRDGIRSGATKVGQRNERTVAVFIPDEARPVFEKILSDYLTGELTAVGNPPNKTKVEAIEAFRAIRLESFWTDDPRALPPNPNDPIWWALWCWRDREDVVLDVCARLSARVAATDRHMQFPETTVIPVLTTRAAIELMLFATGGIAELRRGEETPTFFVDQPRGDQWEWANDLADRVVWPGSDAPAVCLLDTGVNRAHPLLEPALSVDDLHALDSDWGFDDTEGHGTAMAGLALHGNLTAPLSDKSERALAHRLESVKVLPPDKFDPNEPHAYGPLTQAAIALPEISEPDRARVYCMAISNRDVSGARPSAWSASIDQAAAGTMPGDEADAPKRLIVLSSGNIPAEIDPARLQPQDNYPAEDPSQAWNALTVGGYTDLVDIKDGGYEAWAALAAIGDLSPHSRTSVTWPQNAPFKPELVMEAGNRALSPRGNEILTLSSLSLCSTAHAGDPLVTFEATSAATAQAARLAARLAADHPEFWPETTRALIVHSAEWTEPMLRALQQRTGKRDRYELVRRFGYGVPDFERATASAINHLALFAQAQIQPYRLDGTRKFHECHYYDLPIPPDLLGELDNELVDLKITLSYFIDPNPGLSANIDPYRYQSHGLRFDLRRKSESLDEFKQRVNASERLDPRIAPQAAPDDERWMLGPQSISAGSLHCDTWTGPAIELLLRDTICIKPVGGWCRERSTREHCNAVRRYALIVTLRAHNADIDLYTPINTYVDVLLAPETEIEM